MPALLSVPNEWDATRLDLPRVLPRIKLLQCRQPLLEPANAVEARKIADANPGIRVKTINFCGGFVGTTFGPKFEEALRSSVKLPADVVNIFSWAMLTPRIASAIVPLLRQLEASR
jgi:hypothetical protein